MNEIARFLDEDLGTGDVTTKSIVRGERARASVRTREICVLAGVDEAAAVFERLGASVKKLAEDGRQVPARTRVLEIDGGADSILSAERLALNFLMRMSGIATATRLVVERCRIRNPTVQVAATRKTTPGFRAFEKKAVVLGGGHPHRGNLADAILIKDNHIAIAGSVEEAIRRVRSIHPQASIEVEAGNENEAIAAARAGVQAILLDNMSHHDVRRVAAAVRAVHPAAFLEASGGITPESAPLYAAHVDRVSLGSLTHSVAAIDFTLDIDEIGRSPR